MGKDPQNHWPPAQLEGRERLLIGEVLVSSNKDVVFCFGESQQLSVLDPSPTDLCDRTHFDARELPLE
jgi:hypothetical protein